MKEVRQNEALLAMLNGGKKEKTPIEKAEKKVVKNSRKANPRAYERNRGRGGSIPMSYYIPEELIVLLGVKAAKDRKSKSELVVEGLKYILREELAEASKG